MYEIFIIIKLYFKHSIASHNLQRSSNQQGEAIENIESVKKELDMLKNIKEDMKNLKQKGQKKVKNSFKINEEINRRN